MQVRARLIIVSSVSGGGKTSLIKALRQQYPELASAITATTRNAKADEIDGRDYYFFSKEAFKQKLKQGYFLEHALVHNNYYGTPKTAIMANLAENRSIMLNIDVQGYQTILSQARNKGELRPSDILSIFIVPPETEKWRQRLIKRARDSQQEIDARMEQGKLELSHAVNYDYRLKNDDFATSLAEFIAILQKEQVII